MDLVYSTDAYKGISVESVNWKTRLRSISLIQSVLAFICEIVCCVRGCGGIGTNRWSFEVPGK